MNDWLQTLPAPCRATIEAFADPHPPGSAARARLASRAIAELAAEWSSDHGNLEDAVQKLIQFLSSTGQTTLHQPGVNNAISYMLAEGIPADLAAASRLFAQRADEIAQSFDRARESVAHHGAALLSAGDQVLVHDYGPNTCQAIITRAAQQGKELKVVATACRTRRAFGIAVARDALAAGHEATVVTDAGIGWVIQRGGLRAAFVGADAFMPDGSVMTTPGVLTIAALCTRYEVPVYVVTDLWKVLPSMPQDLVRLNDAPDSDGVPEALDWEKAGFKYLNPLVDMAPGDLLTSFITEVGIIAPREAAREAERLYGIGVGPRVLR